MTNELERVLREALVLARQNEGIVTVDHLFDAVLAVAKDAEPSAEFGFIAQRLGTSQPARSTESDPLPTLDQFDEGARRLEPLTTSARELVTRLLSEDASETIRRRFAERGLDQEELRKAFAEFGREGSTSAEPREETAAANFSTQAWSIIREAIRLDGRADGKLERPSAILAAFIDMGLRGGVEKTTDRWLVEQLGTGMSAWSSIRERWRASPSERVGQREAFGERVAALFERAARIAHGVTSGNRRVHSRHLLAAILIEPDEEVREVLGLLGSSVETLKEALREAATKTWRLKELVARWNHWLGTQRDWKIDFQGMLEPSAAIAFNVAAAACRERNAPIDVRTLVAALVARMNESVLESLISRIRGPTEKSLPSELISTLLRFPTLSDEGVASPQLPDCSSDIEGSLSAAVSLLGGASTGLSPDAVFFALWVPARVDNVTAIDPLLAELQLDGDEWLQSADEFIASGPLAKFRDLLRVVARLRRGELAFDRPFLQGDAVSGPIDPARDLLAVTQDAVRFAKLLAAADISPPIALGLFGNWGSGKTFFMGLMRDAMDRLAKDSSGAYVKRIAHIDFNAWHYHDTNLWATLALRIFEGIAKELAGNQPNEADSARRELHQKIDSTKQRLREAKALRQAAIEKRVHLEKTRRRQVAKRDQKLEERVRVQARAAWKALEGSEGTRLVDEAAELAREFGIESVPKSAAELGELARNLESLKGRTQGLSRAVAARFKDLPTAVTTIVLIGLVVLVALGIGAGVETLSRKFDVVPKISGALVEVGAILSAIVGWCAKRARALDDALDRVHTFGERFEAEKKKLGEAATAKIDAEIESVENDIATNDVEIASTEQTIRAANAELERINAGGLVYDFLTERRQAASYTNQLGLVSTVRSDLEKLKALLSDFRVMGKEPIERIVLYVDDLDRCPPERVVEVLQAVHLLLAFDLFNVVVGVDARWLERALRLQFIGRGKTALKPRDYLEKIFQIPYALAPIGPTGFKTLVGGLIESKTEWRSKQRAATAKPAAHPVAAASAPPPASAVAKPAPSPLRAVEAERIAPKAPPSVFENHEEQFIQTLHRFIDRPRLAKRFINIYRLLRVHAAESAEGPFAESPSDEGYRAALVLLAINIAHPSLAPKLLARIEAQGETKKTLLEVVESADQLTASESAERARILARLESVDAPKALAPYSRWAPRVARFSFDWYLPSLEP